MQPLGMCYRALHRRHFRTLYVWLALWLLLCGAVFAGLMLAHAAGVSPAVLYRLLLAALPLNLAASALLLYRRPHW